MHFFLTILYIYKLHIYHKETYTCGGCNCDRRSSERTKGGPEVAVGTVTRVAVLQVDASTSVLTWRRQALVYVCFAVSACEAVLASTCSHSVYVHTRSPELTRIILTHD
jgi:hypothetical protein